MKLFAIAVLVISLMMIGYIVIKKKLGWGWLSTFTVHMILAAGGIYLINYSGLFTEAYIPINPITVGTVTVLGLPGVALIYGLKITLFG